MRKIGSCLLGRVYRGGSWADVDPGRLAASARLWYFPSLRAHYLGFRLVRKV